MSSKVWASPCKEYEVEVVNSVLSEMIRLAREGSPLEVGTSLVGSYSEDGRRATVSGLAPAAPDSKGGRWSYLRGSHGLKNFFSQLFKSTQGRSHYVGEWHSHPGGSPVPSGVDDKNMFDISVDPKEFCPECILIIISISSKVDFGVYVYSNGKKRINVSEVLPDQ